MAKIDDILIPSLTFDEVAAPSTPAATSSVLYVKSDGLFYSKDDAGTETGPFGGSGVADIVDIPTAETDTDLRLAPDGAGGVEWGTGGGGAGATATTGKLVAGNYSLTSTSFVDVDATNAKVVITTGASLLEVSVLANGTHPGSQYIFLDLDIDTVRQGGTNGLVGPSFHTSGGTEHSLCFTYFIAVSAAAHTVKLMYKVSAATGTLYAGTAWPLMITAIEHP